MTAVDAKASGDIRRDDISEPTIQEPTDASARRATWRIGGTGLRLVRSGWMAVRRHAGM